MITVREITNRILKVGTLFMISLTMKFLENWNCFVGEIEEFWIFALERPSNTLKKKKNLMRKSEGSLENQKAKKITDA